MDIVGKWKIKASLRFNDDYEQEWISAEDILSDENVTDGDKRLFAGTVIFCEDGYIRMVMPMPEGISQKDIDDAIAEGELELYEGGVLFEKMPYKIEDGKIFYDSGAKGQISGEDADTWREIRQEDGDLFLFMFRLSFIG